MHSQWLLSVVRWAKHLRWCFILKEETTYIFAFRLLAVYIRITSQFTFKLLYTKSMGILFQSFSHTLWHRHLWNNNPYSTTRKFIPFHLFSFFFFFFFFFFFLFTYFQVLLLWELFSKIFDIIVILGLFPKKIHLGMCLILVHG